MIKMKLKKKSNGPILSDQELSELKQHDVTYNRALIKNNVLPIGPFTRSDFPLLKGEKKNKEFYIRIDLYTIDRYFIDSLTRKRTKETLFYPNSTFRKEYDEVKGKGKDCDGYIFKLYEKLKVDGLGTLTLGIKRISVQKMQLKRKEKPKKLVLKKKSKKLLLRKK